MTEKKPTLRKFVLQLLTDVDAQFESPSSALEALRDMVAKPKKEKAAKQKKESKKYDTILAAPAETLNSVLTYFTYQPARKKYFADVDPAVVSETVLTVAHAIQAVLNNE